MVNSRKMKALLIAAVLAATVAATQVFADRRLQGTWLWDSPNHAGIIFNGSNFVWILGEETVIGNFSVRGNVITLNITHLLDDVEHLWFPHNETWRYNFSFQANNRLVINNWIYLRN